MWALAFDQAVAVAGEAAVALAAAEGPGVAADYLSETAYACTMAGSSPHAWALARLGLGYTGDRRDVAWARLVSFDSERQAAEDTDHPGIGIDTPERRESARILRAAHLDPFAPAPMEAVFSSAEEAEESTNLVLRANRLGEVEPPPRGPGGCRCRPGPKPVRSGAAGPEPARLRIRRSRSPGGGQAALSSPPSFPLAWAVRRTPAVSRRWRCLCGPGRGLGSGQRGLLAAGRVAPPLRQYGLWAISGPLSMRIAAHLGDRGSRPPLPGPSRPLARARPPLDHVPSPPSPAIRRSPLAPRATTIMSRWSRRRSGRRCLVPDFRALFAQPPGSPCPPLRPHRPIRRGGDLVRPGPARPGRDGLPPAPRPGRLRRGAHVRPAPAAAMPTGPARSLTPPDVSSPRSA